MAGTLATQLTPAPLVACTISRNVQEYDLLIEDMEAEFGEGWGDLSFDEALPFFNQPDAARLEIVAVAIDKYDEPHLRQIEEIICRAKDMGLKVILVAGGLGPMALQNLLREGASDFLAYPLAEGALAEAVARLDAPVVPPKTPRPSPVPASQTPVVQAPPQPEVQNAAVETFVQDQSPATPSALGPRPTFGGGKRGAGDPVVIAVHGLAGGVGATTLVTNLAWELANLGVDPAPRVCILDLDLQFGNVSTYLDLERRSLIYEVLSDAQRMDIAAFRHALLTYGEKISVFTAPHDILPLDLVGPEDILALIQLAKAEHDFVIIDMPTPIVHWTEAVLKEAEAYLTVVDLGLRSAQNVVRMVLALRAEKLPFKKLSYVLNRGPKDISGKGRIKRMAENIGIDFRFILQDGGDAVFTATDDGEPVAENNAKLPYRKDVVAMAQKFWDAAQAETFDLDAEAKPKSRGFFSFGR